MNLNTALALLIVVVSGTGLVGCGGGSASSGGNSDAGSNLIVKVSNSNTAYLQSGPDSGTRVVLAISDFLISEARADTPGGHTVTVWDSTGTNQIATGTTNESGEVGFVVNPGQSYIVCFGAAPPGEPTANCVTTEEVSIGKVIVVNVTQDTDDNWVIEEVATEPAEDNLALFEDPSHSHKVIVCHNAGNNNPREISVAQSAVPAHLGHGDELGSCPDPAVSTASSAEDTGNNGNNGNRRGNNNNGDQET